MADEALQVHIDPERLNKYIGDAVLNSVLGTHIKQAIEKQLATYSMNNAIGDCVRSEVQRAIMQLLREEYSEAIKTHVRAHMSNEILRAITDKALDQFLANRID